MVSSDAAYLALLAVVSLERMAELGVSRRHAATALARGGVEYGRRHFRVMKVLHTLFLLSCALEVVALRRPFVPGLGSTMLGLVAGAQALRWWAISSLGVAWNVRVIVVPGARAVTRGPYRFLRHPNYLAVGVEMFALPLVHGAWLTALVFSLANAALLAVRVRCEESALARHSDWAERFGVKRELAAMAGRPAEELR